MLCTAAMTLQEWSVEPLSMTTSTSGRTAQRRAVNHRAKEAIVVVVHDDHAGVGVMLPASGRGSRPRTP